MGATSAVGGKPTTHVRQIRLVQPGQRPAGTTTVFRVPVSSAGGLDASQLTNLVVSPLIILFNI